ncbi:hypothetical protein SK571_44580 [Lentzea sp. BCCO 10_0798]|uniref:Uncharacterized protein n=1 Tax=Lentzea kristufekii TaxID=3095430 RepID=A0ABU4U7C2_9PSEU|nr:hypothetical protein [Lentzea sp. BCCO 10_0798]MDX8056496.1 hypothetical protein [Lentzea sp. BCCO 10_0798]
MLNTALFTAGGHLWNDLAGWTGDPHLSPFRLAGHLAIAGGFWLICASWVRLYQAAAEHRLAAAGPYARERHPQYDARLAHDEEREVPKRFGEQRTVHAARTPAFLPRLRVAPAERVKRSR